MRYPIIAPAEECGVSPLAVSILNATHRLPGRWRVQWAVVIPAMLALLLAMWWTNT